MSNVSLDEASYHEGAKKIIYFESYYSDGKRAFPKLGHLIEQLSESRQFSTTNDPSQADWIFFLEGDSGHYYYHLRRHQVLRDYYKKCYLYGQIKCYLYPIPGVYTSLSRKQLKSGLLRSFCYLPFGEGIDNPYILWDKNEIHERPYFFSFVGAATSWTRRWLMRTDFKRSDILIEDTTDFRFWDLTHSEEQRRHRHSYYAQVIRDSEFVLCPRGTGLGTIRLFEVMRMARVPVIIADNYAFPEGPNWESFSIVIPERRIGDIPRILEKYRSCSKEMGLAAEDAWRKHYAPGVLMEHLCEMVDQIARVPRSHKILERMGWSIKVIIYRFVTALRILARELLIHFWRALGSSCPYRFLDRRSRR
ncbi:MAG: exostosin family protein [Verrucomicrobiota bacterium]